MRADAADGHAARALDTRDGLRAGRHDAAGAPRQLQNDVPILRDGGDARGVSAENLLFLRKTDSDVLEVLRQVKLLLATDAMQELTGRIYGSPVQVLRGDMWSVNTDCYAAIRGAPQLLGLGTGGQ